MKFFGNGLIPISISKWPPSSYIGKQFHLLEPPCDLVLDAKKGNVSYDNYRSQYFSRVLDQLDASTCYNQILELSGNKEPVLLCFEDLSIEGEWCHRRMVADWFESNLSITVPEYVKPAKIRSTLTF